MHVSIPKIKRNSIHSSIPKNFRRAILSSPSARLFSPLHQLSILPYPIPRRDYARNNTCMHTCRLRSYLCLNNHARYITRCQRGIPQWSLLHLRIRAITRRRDFLQQDRINVRLTIQLALMYRLGTNTGEMDQGSSGEGGGREGQAWTQTSGFRDRRAVCQIWFVVDETCTICNHVDDASAAGGSAMEASLRGARSRLANITRGNG